MALDKGTVGDARSSTEAATFIFNSGVGGFIGLRVTGSGIDGCITTLVAIVGAACLSGLFVMGLSVGCLVRLFVTTFTIT